MTIAIDFGRVARELNLPLESVQNTVALLDEDNTVPFVTRYRKAETGALDEEQIRQIQDKVGKLRGLAERKQTILKSLQSQGVLTPELEYQIRQAASPKRLEDLYLPHKPKKQTLATVAKKRGLEPLALEVLGGDPAVEDLRQRAEALVEPQKGLSSVDEVLQGVQHIIAERFSEHAEVRGRLRKILKQTGKLNCTRMEPPKPETPAGGKAKTASEVPAEQQPQPEGHGESQPTADGSAIPPATRSSANSEAGPQGTPHPPAGMPGEAPTGASQTPGPGQAEQGEASDQAGAGGEESVSPPQAAGVQVEATAEGDGRTPPPDATGGQDEQSPSNAIASPGAAAVESSGHTSCPTAEPAAVEQEKNGKQGGVEGSGQEGGSGANATEPVSGSAASASSEAGGAEPVEEAAATEGGKQAESTGKQGGTRGPLSASMAKKAKKRKRLEAAFKDYFGFQESVSRIPPHRVLAINRGERTRILRVKVEADVESMTVEAESLLIPEEHPQREFLKSGVRDAIHRLLLPSLERELRREMTEKAEQHAVAVFARNLRKLLLQPPVSEHRVLAIDPGFRSGCKLTALDEFGNVLGHDIIHVIGKEEWIRKGRAKLVGLVQNHALSVVAIGNGAACRETEQLVVDVMDNELADQDIAFVIVNEAGASVYSTSQVGREELPGYDAVLRSSISIGRRLLDPLSELVKINPSNIGVGMYQHDVKAKHLRKSLDAVVESCVNYVGVDLNTASVSLLRYVSGMNQLTARRLCEYRASHGPFQNRQQLKQVPGFGEATFVQAAGFLKISNGDSPLDATWIHPESYGLAQRVLEAAGCGVEDLRTGEVTGGRARAKRAFGQLEPETESVGPADGRIGKLDATGEDAKPADGANRDGVPDDSSSLEVGSGESEPVEKAAGTAAEDGKAAEATDSADVEENAAVGRDPGEERARQAGGEAAAGERGGAEDFALVARSERPDPTRGGGSVSESSLDRGTERLQALSEKVRQLDVKALSKAWGVSEVVLRDIMDALARPGRDPREDLPAPVFRRGIVKLEDLEPGMRLSGTVLNVVDFGAFVDIGLSDSGLVHISRLADRYVRDPHEVVGVGDVLTVWVVEIDKKRRRVSLTAIEPGTEKPREARERPEKRRKRKTSGKPAPSGKASQESQKRKKDGPPRGKGRKSRPPRKPKPVTPITKDMEEGKEPLRSFSDLMQFYEKKQDDQTKS
ncbi:MAG: Tex-like N-terminal domain-containing protein [Planctomycetota bacterium]